MPKKPEAPALVDDTIEALLDERATLSSQKGKIEEELKDVEQKVKAYLMKNDREKGESLHYKVSMRDDYEINYIDRDYVMGKLAEKGLMSQFMTESFSASYFKKYLLESAKYDDKGNLTDFDDIEGGLELNPKKALTFSNKTK